MHLREYHSFFFCVWGYMSLILVSLMMVAEAAALDAEGLVGMWTTPIMIRHVETADQINRELLPMVAYYHRRWNVTEKAPAHESNGGHGFYRKQTFVNGTKTANWRLLSQSMAGQHLKKEIQAALEKYPMHKEYLLRQERERDGEIRMWATLAQGRHDGHAVHDHPNAAVAGVYYVSAPPGSGPICFYDPRDLPWLARDCERLTPKPGLLVLFPSWLRHSVGPSFTDEPRISVAFNVLGSWLRSTNVHVTIDH